MRRIQILSAWALAVVWAAPAMLAAPIAADALFANLDANGDGLVGRGEAGGEHRLLFDRLLRTGDEDGDGRLSAAEFAAALVPVRAEKAAVEKQDSRLPGADALMVIVARMDADGDARLEAEEIPEVYREAFERMLEPGDANRDGVLDAREIARGAPRLSAMAQVVAARLRIDVEEAAAKLSARQRAAVETMDAYPNVMALLGDPKEAGRLFRRLDANGDRMLSADEAPEQLAERFDAMLQRGDRDGDGQLSNREFLDLARRFAAMQTAPQDSPETQRMVRQLLARFDADGDGRLDEQEAPRRLAAAFSRADLDGDGGIDRTELAAIAAAMSRGAELQAEGKIPSPGANTAKDARRKRAAAPADREDAPAEKRGNK